VHPSTRVCRIALALAHAVGFPDAVTWNIGEAKAPSLKDLTPGEWQRYVCLEAGLIGKPMEVPPNASFAAGQTFVAGVDAPKEKKKAKAVEVA
jgi:D-hexose-6-phosphate mutarotase